MIAQSSRMIEDAKLVKLFLAESQVKRMLFPYFKNIKQRENTINPHPSSGR